MMNPRPSALAALALLGCHSLATAYSGSAKFLMVGDFSDSTATETAFTSRYGGHSFGAATAACPDCRAELVSTTNDSGSFARLKYTLSSSGIGSNFANVGVRLPIDNLWSLDNDLRSATRISFKARTSSTYPDGIILKVSLGSPAFPFQSPTGYARLKTVIASNDWTWYTVAIKEFTFLSWMKTDAAAGTKTISVVGIRPDGVVSERKAAINSRAVAGKLLNADSASSPDYGNDSVNALKHVQYLQFEIDPIYGTGALTLDPDYGAYASSATLDLDSVLIENVDPGWSWTNGAGCTGASSTLEDFSLPRTRPMDRNLAGLPWTAASDTVWAKGTPIQRFQGYSSVWGEGQDTSDWTRPFRFDSTIGSARLYAQLNKGDAVAHPSAGYAELRTALGTPERPMALAGLRAIQFGLLAGGDSILSTRFDKAKLRGISFRVHTASLGDTAAFGVDLPYGALNVRNNGGFVDVCVDASQLKLPTWYSGIRPFSSGDLTGLSWGLKIQNETDVAAGLSRIDVRYVRLFGASDYVSTPVGSTKRPASERGHASYREGRLVVSYTVPGPEADIAVVRPDGSRIASFRAASTARDLALPVALETGTYKVVVRGDGVLRTLPLPVLGR